MERLKQIVEELHADKDLSNEFRQVYADCEAHLKGLEEIRQGLLTVWSEVDNRAPLRGTCEVGRKSKFE